MDDHQRQESHRPGRGQLPQGAAPRSHVDEKSTDSNPPESGAPFLKVIMVGGCIALVTIIILVTSREEELRRNATISHLGSTPVYMHRDETSRNAENTGNQFAVPHGATSPPVRSYQTPHQEENRTSRAAIDRILLEAKPLLSVLRPEGARPLLCVLSPEAKHPLQFPKKHCTHLVYSDVKYDLQKATFTPVSEATYAVLQTLKGTTSLKLLVNMARRTLRDLAPDREGRRFSDAVSDWLTSYGLNGVAFLGQSYQSSVIGTFVPILRVLRNVLGPLKLDIVVGITVTDWDAQPTLIARRLAAIGEHVDYLILETHYQGVLNETCRTAFPSVLYSDDPRNPSVPIAQALSWMTNIILDQKSKVNTCFSLTLGALLFRGAGSALAACKTSQLVSYMKVCKDSQWTLGTTAHVDALAEERLGQGQVESHEATTLLAAKVSRAISMFPLSCVATYQVDLDDYEGECGKPFERLEAVRQAQEKATADDYPPLPAVAPPSLHQTVEEAAPLGSTDSERRRRCMAPGKEFVRPLICVFSDRITVPRNFTRRHCTHVVLSLRRYRRPDSMRNISAHVFQRLKAPDVKVLVALHEDLLLSANAEKLAESSSVLLKGTEVDGLAFLYISQSASQLRQLNVKLQALHNTLKSSGLCLLLSLQLAGYIAQPRIVDNTLRDVSKNVDILVVNSHYPGSSGLCRAVHASVFKQSVNSCVPTVAVETALSWFRFIASTSVDIPFLCFSVDLRVFRYVGTTPHGTCSSEEHLRYSEGCDATGWSTVYDVATDSVMRRKEENLETFDTVTSLRKKVEAAIGQYPKACVAAYNYDFEDVVGRCKDRRLSSVRSALDQTTSSASQIQQQSKESIPVQGDQSGVGDKPLVCVLSKASLATPFVPQAACTHLVHREAWYDVVGGTVHVKESSLGLIANRPNMKHVVGLSGEIFLSTVLGDRAVVEEMATNMAIAIRRMHLDGLAILDFNRTSKTMASFATGLSILRKAFSQGLMLILGLEVLDGSLPTKTMARRLLNTIKLADITIFQTHYRSGRGYCQISYPSVYEYKEGNLVPLATALDWMTALGLPRICISFNMAVLEFDRVNSTNDCQKVIPRNYSETCNNTGWKRDDETSESFSAVREKGSAWQTFESAELLGRKVDRIFSQHPGACVAAFNIDLEDATSTCEDHGRFARLSTIAEKYVVSQAKANFEYETLPQIAEETASIMSAELVGSHALGNHDTQNQSEGDHTEYQHATSDSGSRPFVCFMSRLWAGPTTLPPVPCTHIVLRVEPGGEEVVKQLKERKERLLSPIKYLALRSLKSLKNRLAKVPGYFDGAAVINVRTHSAALAAVGDDLLSFRNLLPKGNTLVVGLEIMDFHRDVVSIAQQLAYIQKFADIIIFQTHFRPDGSFCRTAYPSMYHSANDTCIQTPPIAKVVQWMRLLYSPNLCISFNLAALRFHLTEGPGASELCQDVEEVNDLCYTEEWKTSDEEQYAMATSRHHSDIWISYETGRLLRRKIRKAMSAYPKLCMAAFSVDADGSSKCRKEAYSRVNEMAIATYHRARDPTVQEANKRSKPVPLSKPQKIACVLNGGENMDDIPHDFCSYYIYGYVGYLKEFRQHVLPDSFSLRSINKVRRPGVKIEVAIWQEDFTNFLQDVFEPPEGDRLFMRMLVWLYEYNLDGLGTAYYTTTWADLEKRVSSIHHLGCKLHNVGYDLVFGTTVKDLDSAPLNKLLPSLRVIARSVDLLIVESHVGYQYIEECRVHFPSRMVMTHPYIANSPTISKVQYYIERLGEITDTPVCFSLSLGVRYYELQNASTGRPGFECDLFQYYNYSAVCDKESWWAPPQPDSEIESTWHWRRGAITTYERPQDLVNKVLKIKSKCVALYEVELDDPYGTCIKGRKFPRLQDVYESYESVALIRDEPKKVIAPDEPALICVVTEKFPTIYPPCDYVVYYGVRYVGGDVGFEDTSTNVALARFLGRSGNEHRFVSLVAMGHSWYRDMGAKSEAMEEFGHVVTKFLLKHALKGIALLKLQIYLDDVGELWRFFRSMRCKLSYDGLMLMVGIKLKSDTSEHFMSDLNHLTRAVDIFILETHLEVPPPNTKTNCTGRFPSMMHGTFDAAGSIPIELGVKWMKALPEPQPFLCYSLSMAAFEFDTPSETVPFESPCNAMNIVDYSATCKKWETQAQSNHLAMSTFQPAHGKLYTYDSKSDLVLKVDSAGTPCVAAYHVDYDDPQGHCGDPHLRTGLLNESLYELEKTRRLMRDQDSGRRSQKPVGPQNTVMCVFHENTTHISHLPSSVCDYIILHAFALHDGLNERAYPSLMDDARQLAKEGTTTLVMMMSADSLAAKWKAGRRVYSFVQEIISFMIENGFNGVAFGFTQTSQADFAAQAAILLRMRYAMQLANRTEFEIFIAVPFSIRWLIWSRGAVFSYVDAIIFTTHNDTVDKPCTVKFAASYEMDNFILSSVTEAALLMENLSKTNRSLPLMCFTISLAALKFTGTASDAYVGDRCDGMTHVPYEQTCPMGLREYTASDAVAAYMVGHLHMFTYENEHTVAMKTIGMTGILPKVCVATYSTELEDVSGNCIARPPASRLRAIKYSLSIPEHTSTRYHIKNPLICTVGKSPKIPRPIPADYCDILIYTEVMFDPKNYVVRPTHNMTPFNDFFDFYDASYYDFNRPRIAIALDPKSLEAREYQSKQGLEDLANVFSSWLALSKTDGLAIINDVVSEHSLQRHTTFMEKMRSVSFKKRKHMILLYGASIIEGYTNWAKTDIATYVDVLILMVHRNTWTVTPCVVWVPTTFPNGSEPSQKLVLKNSVRGLEAVVPTVPAFAVSINLAVREFKTEFHVRDDSCIFEKWVNFSKVCGSTVRPVGHFSGAYQDRDSVTRRAFETDDSVRLKVRYYNEWVEGMGVALFNIDYEVVQSPCPYVRGGYSRMMSAYEQTSMNRGHWDTPATAPPTDANTTEVEPTAEPGKLSANAMACVFGKETNVLPKKFPLYMCDYVVLMVVTYHGPESSFLEIGKPDLLQKFLDIPGMDLHKTPYYLVGFHEESFDKKWIYNPTLYVHFADRVTIFMQHTAMKAHGIFIEFGILVGDHPVHFQNIVERTRHEVARVRHADLFKVGMGAVYPLRPRKWEDYALLIHYLDVMVMVTHRTKLEEGGCRIVAPSTLSYGVYGLGLWSWTTDVMRAMINIAGKKHMPPMCFSINMAVMRFNVTGLRVPFDGYCEDEQWVNYAETCPSFRAPTYISARRLSGYSRRRNNIWTFEDEDTVSMKTESSAREYASLCVAAYNVNYEDEGVCVERSPYSRMRALRKSLNYIISRVGNLYDPPRGAFFFDPLNPSPPPPMNRTLIRTYNYGKPSYKKKKRRRIAFSERSSNGSRIRPSTPKGPTPTVCYFNAPAPGTTCVAKRVCSHVIYDAPDYDSTQGIFSSTGGVWESAFAAATADIIDLFLGTKAKSLLNLYYQGCEILEEFLKAVLDLATKAEGFLGVSVSILHKLTARDAEHFPDVIHKVRTSLDSMNMTAVFVVSPAAVNDADLMALIADAADMIVYAGNIATETHRRHQSARSNEKFPDGDAPTTTSSMDGLLELSQRFYDDSAVCVSLNLAVYNCTDNVCMKATYPDVCNLTGTMHPVYSAMTATVGSSVFIYDNEATLSSKLDNFRQQFPRACVSLLNADAEDDSHKCGTREPFSRLVQVRNILGGGEEMTSEPTDQTTTRAAPLPQSPVTAAPWGGIPTPTSSGTAPSTIQNATLICISGPSAKEDYLVHVPAALCDYIVYPRGSYDYRKRDIHSAKPIGGHQAVLTLNSSTYVDDWVTDTPALLAFANTLLTVMRRDRWTAFGIFLEDPNHTSNIVTVHAAVLTVLMQNNPAPFQLVVGSVPLRDGRAFFGLLLGSDVFIMMTQHISVKPCTIEPPTRTPAFRAFIADQSHDDLVSLIHRWRVSNKLHTLICAPISLAVVTYRLLYEEMKNTGDNCISQVAENYAQTCNKATTRDANAVYYSNATHLMAFENEETSLAQMQEYYNKIDDPCVAAFSVDCEDSTGLCGPAFSRLNAIRVQLDKYNISASGATTEAVAPTDGISTASPETVMTGSPIAASSESTTIPTPETVMTPLPTTQSSANAPLSTTPSSSAGTTSSTASPPNVTGSSLGTATTEPETKSPVHIATSPETDATALPTTPSSASPTPSGSAGTTAAASPPNVTESSSLETTSPVHSTASPETIAPPLPTTPSSASPTPSGSAGTTTAAALPPNVTGSSSLETTSPVHSTASPETIAPPLPTTPSSASPTPSGSAGTTTAAALPPNVTGSSSLETTSPVHSTASPETIAPPLPTTPSSASPTPSGSAGTTTAAASPPNVTESSSLETTSPVHSTASPETIAPPLPTTPSSASPTPSGSAGTTTAAALPPNVTGSSSLETTSPVHSTASPETIAPPLPTTPSSASPTPSGSAGTTTAAALPPNVTGSSSLETTSPVHSTASPETIAPPLPTTPSSASPTPSGSAGTTTAAALPPNVTGSSSLETTSPVHSTAGPETIAPPLPTTPSSASPTPSGSAGTTTAAALPPNVTGSSSLETTSPVPSTASPETIAPPLPTTPSSASPTPSGSAGTTTAAALPPNVTGSSSLETTSPVHSTAGPETIAPPLPTTPSSASPTPSGSAGTTTAAASPPNVTESSLESATTEHGVTPVSTPSPWVGNTLLCFLAPPLVLHTNFPEDACDVVIYDAVCLKGNADTQVDDSEWKAFLDLKEKLQNHTKKLKFAANLDTVCLLNGSNVDKDLVKAAVINAASMLATYNLSAGAVVVQDSRHEPSIQWTDVMKQYRTSMEKEAVDGILIFGASPTYLSNKVVLNAILPLVDVLVYTNHHTIVKDEPCTVSHPSGMFFEDQNNHSVETIKQHQDKVVCKAVSMAVFRYALIAMNDTFGSTCRQEVMDSYGEVCPPPRIGNPDEPTWYPIHYKDRFNLITYESEMTLQEKVLALRKLVNRVCIAAFHVEFEAPTGLCPHRSGFTRIKQMRNALDNPVDYVPPDIPGFDEGTAGTVSTPSAAESHRRLAKEPSIQARLVCFVAPPVKTVQDYPSYLCDYVVYQAARYDIASDHISFSDGTSWTEFLKLKKHPATRFMVAIHSQSLINITRAHVAESFVNGVPAWLQKNQFGGVAALFDSEDDALRAYDTLKVLRERLDKFQHGTYVLLLGATAALPVHLVQLAHTFVLVTNHVPSATPCKVSYPSVTTHMSTLSEPLLLAKSLREVASDVSVCLSINLAVLVFWQEKVDRTVGAMCKQGAETDFAELCRQAEVKITGDREWMSAYLQADENNTLYTFETEDFLATKVAFFRSWFPDVCVAAFHTERDIYAHPCPLLPPFSRLIKIADTLYRNVQNLI
ncbi:uncharacterized protein LOC135388024 isoform X2 [Ornithodoros turicata]|uniref:uncharacterized protein LOC135388024 isoform X2 n=1 Tax=Ornithodoros turicata TaxID=34597 RepID=UPI00313868B8